MTARKVRLGPGGKVLMVLIGVGLILWGLDAYGYLDGLRKDLGWERGKAATAVHRAVSPAAGSPKAVPPKPAAPTAGDTLAPAPRTAPTPRPAGAPALPGSVSGALRDGGDALWSGAGGPTPQARLEAVVQGRLDLVPVALPDLLLFDDGSGRLVVLGAVPPVPRFLCATGGDPVQVLVGGARVQVDRLSDRLRAGLLLEAHGAEATALDADGGPEVTLGPSRVAGDRCADLAALGVDGPRVVVARASAVRLEGRAYLAAARRRGALGRGARAWLAAPAADAYGYAARAAVLAHLVAVLQSTTAPAVPAVARDLLGADAGGILGLYGPAAPTPDPHAKATPVRSTATPPSRAPPPSRPTGGAR